MDRYALVDSTGNVVNVIVWDGQSEWTSRPDLRVIRCFTDSVAPGWTHNGVDFVPPAIPA